MTACNPSNQSNPSNPYNQSNSSNPNSPSEECIYSFSDVIRHPPRTPGRKRAYFTQFSQLPEAIDAFDASDAIDAAEAIHTIDVADDIPMFFPTSKSLLIFDDDASKDDIDDIGSDDGDNGDEEFSKFAASLRSLRSLSRAPSPPSLAIEARPLHGTKIPRIERHGTRGALIGFDDTLRTSRTLIGGNRNELPRMEYYGKTRPQFSLEGIPPLPFAFPSAPDADEADEARDDTPKPSSSSEMQGDLMETSATSATSPTCPTGPTHAPISRTRPGIWNARDARRLPSIPFSVNSAGGEISELASIKEEDCSDYSYSFQRRPLRRASIQNSQTAKCA